MGRTTRLQNGRAKRFRAKKWRLDSKGGSELPAFKRYLATSPDRHGLKEPSFCPKSFCPPALPGPRRSLVAAFQRPPRPESVPICESTANLWPSVFQSFTPSPVNACIGIKSGQRNGDKGIGFSCPHSPAVPPPRGNDRVGIG